ncbi:hypothetical protein E3T46_05790 [Cryobacterium sp. Hh11]|uniref:hypothetical protein n=1 Tax=Cryobacterium sp. Hh11 TaxID=2555868 RepID=UPI00106B9994|nr:hypothetical protein [Cryobacterium sp. Hh11]TFD52377.1 hypothetical protein E3T46_05790 [Cryobacterium sp. Hh11]
MTVRHAARVETLLPADTFPGTGILLALDVDGVLNTIDVDLWERNRRDGQSYEKAMPPIANGFERRHVRTAHGHKYWVDIDPAVVQALDTFIQTNNVELGWLTSWGPNVRAFIEQALDGKLSGGFVLASRPPRYRGAVPAAWKRTALRARVESTQQPWIWADDEEIALARASRDFDNDRSLLCHTSCLSRRPLSGSPWTTSQQWSGSHWHSASVYAPAR